MIISAPATRAPWMQFSPTPPQPNTATVLPARTRAVLTAAPKPVITPQPISAACAKGISLGMTTGATAGTMVWVAKVPVSVKRCSRSPPTVPRWPVEGGARQQLGQPC